MAVLAPLQLLQRSPLQHDLCFALLCGTIDIHRNDRILSIIVDRAFRQAAQAIDLFVAAKKGRLPELLAKLHLTDTDVNTRFELNQTAVYQATQHGHTEALQLLLQCGSDPNAADMYGSTAVYVAVQNRRTEALQLLLQFGGNPNVAIHDGTTAVHYASGAAGANTEVLRLLLQFGVDVNVVNSSGTTPLGLARRWPRADAAALLEAAQLN